MSVGAVEIRLSANGIVRELADGKRENLVDVLSFCLLHCQYSLHVSKRKKKKILEVY